MADKSVLAYKIFHRRLCSWGWHAIAALTEKFRTQRKAILQRLRRTR